jgi:hypothetical protein
MTISKRRFLLGVSGAIAVAVLGGMPRLEAGAAKEPALKIEAHPGTIVRWSVPGTKSCGMGTKSWPALQETCYYPIDLEQKPGALRVSRRGAGPLAYAQISVLASEYGREDITLGDIPQANPSPEDRQRNVRDQALVGKIWTRRVGPARFTLPLAPPASPLPDPKGFGAEWVFNGDPDSAELHSGADYALPASTPVKAVADGTVALAQELFFAGGAVFIDHGDGLVSMYFHLADIKVQAGQDVRQGETLGVVGSTGRATGPHLHLGVRWHGARVDPQPLLSDPAKIPAIGP